MQVKKGKWIEIGIILVLLAGAYLRLSGIYWGDFQYLHPDERFLVWVGSDIRPVDSLGAYFDTVNSTLNPNNVGHGFYVYGTLPMFITRYLVEGIYHHSGFAEMTRAGRPLSALFDLLTVYLIFLIGKRLFGPKTGLLAAAFLAVAVMPIQQSHFFTMDTFANAFLVLALYFAVLVAQRTPEMPPDGRMSDHPWFWPSLGFGLALGCAVASKLNTAPVALTLPLAMALSWRENAPEEQQRWLRDAVVYLAVAAGLSVLIFRLFQPYAFSGPGFFGLKPNPQWLANLKDLRNQIGGDVDFPPALQWARRTPLWFAWKNLTVWGLSLPLGLLAWAGFLWMGWGLLRRWRHPALIIWVWTAVYFLWQGSAFNPTMRYFLPVYPALALSAAFLVRQLRIPKFRAFNLVIGLSVLAVAAAWAFAFTRIYVRPTTRVEASRWIYQHIPGAIQVHVQTPDGEFNQQMAVPYNYQITGALPFVTSITPKVAGQLDGLLLPHITDQESTPAGKTLTVTVSATPDGSQVLASGQVTADFPLLGETPGGLTDYKIQFDHPVNVSPGQPVYLTLTIPPGASGVQLNGSGLANESSWDDGLPLRMDGYDGYGGIYQGGLNFEMYWDDNADKLARFQNTLDRADYVLISSSRQWATTTRVPERYPLTSAYYRALLGCPAERSLEWCYNVAEVGTFQGQLGYQLIKVFQSDPAIGNFRINDQFAEEAFTVYDHPKVFIFQKTAAYRPEDVARILGAVDLSHVVHVTPKKAGSSPGTLTLPPERLAEQQAGGTWAELFPPDGLLNRSQPLSVLVWLLAVSLLGWLVYPLLRMAMPGLADHGFPMTRTAGMLLLSYLVWLAGSARIPYSRSTISAAFVLLALAGGLSAWGQRADLKEEWHIHRTAILRAEALFFAAFLLFLLVRWGNPDLWHPWKGGEKPMDFSYFNAVLKSTSFPPYDPWYAGGYINYYYYGFLMVGVLVKWLGITPAVAYNLILPTLFAMLAVGGYSLARNLFLSVRPERKEGGERVGWAAALGVAVLGNLGTVRMIYQGFQRLAAPGGTLDAGAGLLRQWGWALSGFFKALGGAALPFSRGDWYWLPSRAIPATGEVEPITEFPMFTFLYADLHAHMMALPVTLLALSWAVGMFLWTRKASQSKLVWRRLGWSVLFGGLVIGVLRPTNTWDFPTYLALGMMATGWWFWQRGKAGGRSGVPEAILSALALAGLSLALFQPFAHWYGQAYTAVDYWKGSHTPTSAYLVHWGLFLFLIVSWMVWETRDWLASTPVTALQKLQPYRSYILGGLFLALMWTVVLVIFQVYIAWMVIPLMVWTGVLLFRPGMADAKRAVLFMVGTGLALTLVVELVVLRGDIGRMNTVFKFYLQVWTLFAVSAAFALGWMYSAEIPWGLRLRTAWQGLLIVLFVAALLFPIMGGMAKISDRMAPEAPHTLDGMAYMDFGHYADQNVEMDLSQDARAIRWMQRNVKGSPVIVEGNTVEYRWGTRYTIYTGLPGVIGWNWHQRQQRAINPGEWIFQRVTEVGAFYLTTDRQEAEAFLRKYNVRYIVVGQLERAYYPGPGLEKFDGLNGDLWRQVYRDTETAIYQVMP